MDFKKIHSTELAARELIDGITLIFKSNKQSLGIFMDLSKEFDSLHHTLYCYTSYPIMV